MNHDLVSAAEIRKTAEVFTHLAAKLEDGNYNLKDVTVMLLDSVDTSVEALRSAGLPPTAFMAVLPWLRTERQATNLRVVDPLTDPHIWAIADDGCNSCCHGELWRINAEEKWKNLGFKCYFRNKAPMSFDGVGSTQTHGKVKMHMALRLEETGLILPSTLSSHEIPKKVTPLLLSQALQAHLGMTKCVRRGSITLDDYEDANLEVVRDINSGLFLIRIDHLVQSMYGKHDGFSEMLIDPDQDFLPSASEEESQENKVHVGYPAVEIQPRTYGFEPSYLNAPTFVVTCGAMTFENTGLSMGLSKEFQESLGEIPKGRKRPNIDFDSHAHRLAFMNSFSANYPELVKDRNIYSLDCTLFHNPDRSKELRRHVGLSPRIQEEVVDDENFMRVIDPLKTYDPTKKNLVIACCISCKHRGVAVGELATIGLDKLFFDGTDEKSSGKVVLCNLSERDHWYGTCKGRCDWCSLKNKAANDRGQTTSPQQYERLKR